MTSYRLYALSAEERIAEAREEQFMDDQSALRQAEAYRDGHYAVEVWAGERLVGRVGGDFTLR